MKKTIRAIYVPYDSGHYNLRMGRGPDAFRAAGISDQFNAAGYDVIEDRLQFPEKFLPEIGTAFRINRSVAEKVRLAHAAGEFPVIFSGNCNVALGALSGLSDPGCKVFWFDGHGDYNTPETSPSGYLDGMALAIATGRCWAAVASTIPGYYICSDDNVVLLAARDLDSEELKIIENSSATRINVEEFGDPDITFPSGGSGNAHLHIDLDFLDPSEAPANQYSPPAGPTVAQASEMIGRICAAFSVRSITMASYDPDFDPDGKGLRAGMTLLSRALSSLSSKD